jgi:hypothetical protein
MKQELLFIIQCLYFYVCSFPDQMIIMIQIQTLHELGVDCRTYRAGSGGFSLCRLKFHCNMTQERKLVLLFGL